MRKRGMLGDVKKQFVTWHNYVMAAQSVWLLGTLGVFYTKVAAHYNLSWMNFYSVSMQDSTVVDMFVLTHATFVGFKVWEWLDTVILALNDKPIILLHWWHHATIVIAFYTGVYSSANFWIGFVNSFIHVVMYLYYADVTWIKPFAKYTPPPI